jgi:hypothetical protein
MAGYTDGSWAHVQFLEVGWLGFAAFVSRALLEWDFIFFIVRRRDALWTAGGTLRRRSRQAADATVPLYGMN